MTGTARVWALIVIWVLVAGATLVGGLFVAGGAPAPPPEGIPGAQPLVSWGTVALRMLTTVLGAVTVGFLVVARWRRERPALVPFLGLAWAAFLILQVFFVLANVLALPLREATSFGLVLTYAGELASTRALLISGVLAFAVALGTILSAQVHRALIALALVAASLPSLANHASGLGDHALALTSNAAHAAAASLWIGSAVALVLTIRSHTLDDQGTFRRFSGVALICWFMLAVSGFVNGYVRLEDSAQLVTTGYGQILLAKTALLILVGVVGWRVKVRWAARGRTFALFGIDVVLLGAALGLGVALASSPYPRFPVPFTSLAEALLGSAPPGPPTVQSLLLGFRFDPVFAVIVIAGCALLIWHWPTWPPHRRLPWIAGLGLLLWSTNGGLAEYAPVMPGAGTIQIAMLAGPVALLLARGWRGQAPDRLALSAGAFAALLGAAAFIGGWTVGSYLTRTALLVAVLVAGTLLFTRLGRDRRSLIAVGVIAAILAATAPLWTSVAPWYLVLQPAWLLDPARNALVGALIAAGLMGGSLGAGLLRRMPDLPVSVDHHRGERQTEPS